MNIKGLKRHTKDAAVEVKILRDKACFFFSHKNCEYFPCHKTDEPDSFNCLFCYCPLYCLGSRCGGNFVYNDGIKDCSNCMVPHQKNSHEYINSRFSEIAEGIRNQA